ncbi:hypothetical protein PM02_18220 [Sulfitobacter mediterraneus]|uniref:Glycosyl transferase family 1 domain-containing protein n=1 Tax=Sulfitobacter mediterraneus TaxID=83219 RepID=A0A061SQE9_9RHOB|nr:hypothetical protein PM02_18220 [Sulfitobacter mediterraneus]
MRLLIDLQALQRPNRFGAGRCYLEKLVPALIAAAPDHDVAVHLLFNTSFPQTIPALQRQFAEVHKQGRLHVFHAGPDGLIQPKMVAHIQTFCSAGIAADLTLCLDGPSLDPVCDNPLFPKMTTQHLSLKELGKKTKFFNALDKNEGNARSISARKEVYQHLGLARPYLLFVGNSRNAGHLFPTDIIDAYANLPASLRPHLDLVIAGDFTLPALHTLHQSLRHHNLPANTTHIHLAPTAKAVAQLIAGAALLIDLSTEDSCAGMAEDAAAAQVPVLAVDSPAHQQTLGAQEGLFPGQSAKALEQALNRLLSRSDGLTTLALSQQQLGRRIDWPQTAQALLQDVLQGIKPSHQVHVDDWGAEQARLDGLEAKTIAALEAENRQLHLKDPVLQHIARAVAATRAEIEKALRGPAFSPSRPAKSWRIEGPFDSSYSLAAVNRETARALRRANWPVALFSAEGPGPYEPDLAYLKSHPDLLPLMQAADRLTETTADITSRNMFPPRCDDMRSRYNLLHGYAWEETGFPTTYRRDINAHLQGLLVTSPHVRRVFINAGIRVPITVVGNGVDHLKTRPARLPFALPKRKFRILHVSSCFPRKGTDVLLKAYAEAFAGDSKAEKEVCLIIKTHDNPHNTIAADVAALQADHPILPPIVVETTDLSPAQLQRLYKKANLLVAPSRAEGFCLPIAEAVLAGTPVLTTGWSGQTIFRDNPMVKFIDYHFESAGSHLETSNSVWAEPSVSHLASLLRTARTSPALKWRKKRRAQRAMRKTHSWDNVALKSTQAIKSIANSTPKTPPRIGWVSTFNTRCGIATYSDHLLKGFPDVVTVLANESDEITQTDTSTLRRCWVSGKQDPLDNLYTTITREDLEIIVIQFNYGFYNFAALGRLIRRLKADQRQVVLMMHSTDDTPHPPENWLSGIQQDLALCDRILVHSIHDLNRLKDLDLVDNAALFPHGVPETQQTPAAALTPERPFVLGTYGFLLPQKGYGALIDALALLRAEGRNVVLKMVNAEYPALVSAQLAETIRSQIVRLGLTAHVDFCTDFLEDAESYKRLSETDILVFPYRPTTESASGAVRQALAVSRPIATTPLPIFEDVSGLTLPLPGFSAPEIAEGLGGIIDQMSRPDQDGAVAQSLRHAQNWRQANGYSQLSERLYAILLALHQA